MEALVALVILSLGVISVAAMQLKALHSAGSGYRGSLASVAALDAQERIWATARQVTRCQDVPLAAIESAWRDAWFFADQAPLRHGAHPAQGRITQAGCQFGVTVLIDTPHDEHGTRMEYQFLLPL